MPTKTAKKTKTTKRAPRKATKKKAARKPAKKRAPAVISPAADHSDDVNSSDDLGGDELTSSGDGGFGD